MKNREAKEGAEIKILDAASEDARGIREVQYEAWLATYPNDVIGITEDDVHARFKDSFEEKVKESEQLIAKHEDEKKYVVAKDHGRVIGFALAKKHADRNQLQAIYILPAYQGKGVGKRLWEEARTVFDTAKDTIVEVASYNTTAIMFYKSLGFEETGTEFRDERLKMKSGIILPEIRLIKKAGTP